MLCRSHGVASHRPPLKILEGTCGQALVYASGSFYSNIISHRAATVNVGVSRQKALVSPLVSPWFRLLSLGFAWFCFGFDGPQRHSAEFCRRRGLLQKLFEVLQKSSVFKAFLQASTRRQTPKESAFRSRNPLARRERTTHSFNTVFNRIEILGIEPNACATMDQFWG